MTKTAKAEAIATLGIDLGKNVSSVVGMDARGEVVLRRRVRRATLVALANDLPACTVAMEAWLAARTTSGASSPCRGTRCG